MIFFKKDSHNLLKSVRKLEGKPNKNLMIVKNQKKHRGTEKEKVLKIWKEHLKQHLNTKCRHDENILQSIPITTPGIKALTEELIIAKEVVRKAISSNLITLELLKAGGEPIVSTLQLIFSKLLNEENTPTHFSKMLIKPVYKKGDKSLPENYRAIALFPIPEKVLKKSCSAKYVRKTELLSSDRQYGFRPNRGTIDAIFFVRQLIQKSKERGISRHYHFLNFKSPFEIIWRKTWKMMRPIGMCNRIIIEKINIIEKMYGKQQAKLL